MTSLHRFTLNFTVDLPIPSCLVIATNLSSSLSKHVKQKNDTKLCETEKKLWDQKRFIWVSLGSNIEKLLSFLLNQYPSICWNKTF